MSEANKQPSAEPMILLQGVNKWYGQFHVLKDINLSVQPGERIVLCGPSGSGKSTTIRCINRLEEHQQGRIVVDGTELTHDGAPRSRHGVPALQPVPAPDRAAELHLGADVGAQDAQASG